MRQPLFKDFISSSSTLREFRQYAHCLLDSCFDSRGLVARQRLQLIAHLRGVPVHESHAVAHANNELAEHRTAAAHVGTDVHHADLLGLGLDLDPGTGREQHGKGGEKGNVEARRHGWSFGILDLAESSERRLTRSANRSSAIQQARTLPQERGDSPQVARAPACPARVGAAKAWSNASKSVCASSCRFGIDFLEFPPLTCLMRASMNILRSSLLRPALALLCLSPACALATTEPVHGLDLAGSASSLGLGAGCNGPVNALVEAPDGGIYVGGYFSLCGDVTVNNIARFDPKTQSWSALGSSSSNGVNASVNALVIHEGVLIVAGNFGKAMLGDNNALMVKQIAIWDGATWHRLEGESDIDPVTVNALLSTPAGLYVAGEFNAETGGEQFSNIALWNGSSFSPVGPGSGRWEGWIESVAVFQGELHIAGILNMLPISGHRPTGGRRIARWSQGAWRVVGTEGGGALAGGSSVLALRLAVYDGALYLGGEFSTVDAGAANPVDVRNIARWDGSQWSAVGAGLDGRVLALHSNAESLLAGGRFSIAGTAASPKLARWTGSAWEPASPQPIGGGASEVRTLATSSAGDLIGGEFGWTGGAPQKIVNHVAQLNRGNWTALGTSAGGGANGAIFELHEHLGELFAGGVFSTIGGVAAGGVARHDGSRWRALGPDGAGLDGPVLAFASNGQTLVLGGAFTMIEQGDQRTPSARLAVWNGSSLAPLGPGVGTDGIVRALLQDGEGLVVGGTFGQVSAAGSVIEARSLARLEADGWTIFGSGVMNGVQGTVEALERFDERLYVSGNFRFASDPSGAIEARGIASWNGVRWEGLGSGTGSGLALIRNMPSGPAYAWALQASPEGLYVGGNFYEANTGDASAVAVRNIALWTGSEWRPVGGPDQGVDGFVGALQMRGTQLLIGGAFSNIQLGDGMELPSPRTAIFDQGRWAPSRFPIGQSQMFEAVYDIHPTRNGAMAAGFFGNGAGNPASHLALIELPLFLSGFEAKESAQP